MEKVAVSVVIPVYNVEKYLRECMDSVLAQTLTNIEIICVDDGSTDNSLQILNEYKNADKRVKVIHKENSGYGNTMNVGNSVATGEYLAILESDDYIDANMYEDLYRCAKEHDLDFVKSTYYNFCDKGGERYFELVSWVNDKSMYDQVLQRKEIKELFRGSNAHWSGIYKKDFLDRCRIKYNETPGASYQDLGFHFQTMVFAERGYVKSQPYYRYRQDNPNSSVVNREKVFCIMDEHKFIYDILKQDELLFGEYNDVFQVIKYGGYMFTFNRIADEYKKGFVQRVKEDYEQSISCGEMNWSRLSKTEIRNIEYVISRGEALVDEYLLKGEKIYEEIKAFKEIVIYGAGVKGQEIINILKRYLDTFEGIYFAVSELKNSKKMHCGYLVKSIYEFVTNKEDIAVIIGVSELYETEVLKVVQQLEFKNIVLIK